MDNEKKIKELLPSKQYAVSGWLAEAKSIGVEIEIFEAYRTQERQDWLFAQGRIRNGKIVTWTRHSLHTDRLAIDVRVRSGLWRNAVALIRNYGITQPLPGLDPYHLELNEVPDEAPLFGGFPTPQAFLASLLRAILRPQGVLRAGMMRRAIERLKKIVTGK